MRPPCHCSHNKDITAKIVYIACGPATLARDIKSLMSNGYAIMNIQPFDMFPQTGHVETDADGKIRKIRYGAKDVNYK